MLSVDEIVKLLLVSSLAFSIVGISFQIIRLLGKVIGVLDELKNPVKNFSKLADLILGDYESGRKFIYKILASIKDSVNLFALFGKILNFFGKKKDMNKSEKLEKEK